MLSGTSNMQRMGSVYTLTWDDVTVWGDGVAFIKHKKLSTIEPLGETLQVLMNSTFQLVNLLTHILVPDLRDKYEQELKILDANLSKICISQYLNY